MDDVPVSDLLRCAIQVVGRIAIPHEQVGKIVVLNAEQLKAYNLCDGSKTQAQVGKAAGLDTGNFSRTVARWIASGVLFKIGSGRDARLLHLYPLIKSDFKLKRKRKAVGRKRKGQRKRARKQRA